MLTRVDVEEPERPERVHLQGLRTLVVDDNATNRKILLEQLQSWGCEVSLQSSAAAALAALREADKPFGLLITDMQMPEMDGANLVEAIRAEAAHKDLPIIVLTSMGNHSEFLKAEEFGVAAVLVKPARQSEMFDAIVKACSERRFVKASRKRKTHIPAAELTGMSVLLAEDNPVNQKVAVQMLRKLGCRVHAVGDGREAVAAALTSQFDVVILDVQMPVMDGLAAAREIRTVEGAGARIPLVALTANAMAGDREICIDAGMDAYLAKPVKAAELQDTLTAFPFERRAEETLPCSLFDSSRLGDISAGDDTFVRDIIDSFLEQLPMLLAAASKADTAEELKATAHKLKGSARSVGADALGLTAEVVEHLAAAGDHKRALAELPKLAAQADLFRSLFGSLEQKAA